MHLDPGFWYFLPSRGMPSAACVVWGDRVSDHYRFGATLGDVPTLWREPQIGAFLGLLDKDRLLKTALNFPVTRRCLVRACTPSPQLLMRLGHPGLIHQRQQKDSPNPYLAKTGISSVLHGMR